MIGAAAPSLAGKSFDTLIVGSGPAGLTLALELARLGLPSLVLESGDAAAGPVQDLSQADILDPKLHDDMAIAVARRFGGTSNLWGGRCIPLDPVDFEPRAFSGGVRWPIPHRELAKHYPAACRYTRSGEALFVHPAEGLADADGAFETHSIERSSNVPAFQRGHAEALKASPLIDVRLGCTIIDFDLAESGALRGIVVAGRDGARATVTAKTFVLAAGGLESTRLLLNLQRRHPDLFGGSAGALGRHYMGHIVGEIADVVFNGPAADAAFDFWRDGHGSFVRRRMTPGAATMRADNLPNIAFWPVVPPIADARHRSGPLSAVALALANPALSGWLVPAAIRKRHLTGALDWRAHLRNLLREAPQTAGFLAAFAKRRYLSRERVSGYFVRNPARRYGLSYSAEQAPFRDSRVYLTEATDRLGLPRLAIDVRFDPDAAPAIGRAHLALERWLTATGIGRIEHRQDRARAAGAIMAKLGHGTHQIGTARMGFSRSDAVVDADLRTFDVPNLFVLGSATFPTSGQANPTLSIVAFAVRLAERLALEAARPVEVAARQAPVKRRISAS